MATRSADLLLAIAARHRPLVRAAERGLFGFGPLVACLALLVLQLRLHVVVVDFRFVYYSAVVRLFAGTSPYAVTHAQVADGTPLVNPALAVLAFAPFGLMSATYAQAVWLLVCLACVPAVLWVLNVRDWRLYGLAFLWSPVFDGWQSGNLTLPLVLAVLWQSRILTDGALPARERGPAVDADAAIAEDTAEVEALLARKYSWLWRAYRELTRANERLHHRPPPESVAIEIGLR